MKATQKTRRLTITAVLAALATVLMALEIPLPFLPPFLKVDPSAVPILIGGFVFGPVAALLMSLIKSTLHLLVTSTGGVGELADFIVTASFTVTASIIYSKNRTKKGAFMACASGVVAITFMGALANKLLLIPFYSKVMPIDVIIDICGKINPLITDVNSYILYGAVPFNMIKGIIIAAITTIVYKKMAGYIKTLI